MSRCVVAGRRAGALSIYGTEYTRPFGTGNGYGDGRAILYLKESSMDSAGKW